MSSNQKPGLGQLLVGLRASAGCVLSVVIGDVDKGLSEAFLGAKEM